MSIFNVSFLITLYKSFNSKNKNIKSNNNLDKKSITLVIRSLTKNIVNICSYKFKKSKRLSKA